MSSSKDMLVSGIKRYHDFAEHRCMEPMEDGDWVDFDDHSAIVTKLRADLDEALGALKDAQDTFLNIGPGADIEADPEETSPDDSIAHEAGLAYQRIDAILSKHSKEVTDNKQ